jgi:hypothetical protein
LSNQGQVFALYELRQFVVGSGGTPATITAIS